MCHTIYVYHQQLSILFFFLFVINEFVLQDLTPQYIYIYRESNDQIKIVIPFQTCEHKHLIIGDCTSNIY